MTFIEKIDALCQTRGLSERALAQRLGINQSSISRWRNRGSLPRRPIAKKLADLFELPVATLIDDGVALDMNYLAKPYRDAAALAEKTFPNNQDAGQILFEHQMEVKKAKGQYAKVANFLREKSRVLRSQANQLDDEAERIESLI